MMPAPLPATGASRRARPPAARALAHGAAFLVAVATLLPVNAPAHVISVGHVLVAVREQEIELSLRLLMRDVLRRFPLDQNGDGDVAESELEAGRPEVLAYLEKTVEVTADGEPLPREVARFGFETLAGNVRNFLEVKLVFRARAPIRNYTIRAQPLTELHQHGRLYGGIQQGERWEAFVFYPGATYTGTRLGGVAHASRFLWEGIVHIFTGYDHIAFLTALLLTGGGVLGVIKIVSAFTLAHTITLSLAALNFVLLPGRLVESGIAISIVVVAAENLSPRPLVPTRWLVAFLFGLIHGFGFASVLQELYLPTAQLASSLFFFNAGVEVGQIAVVLLVTPLLLLVRRTRAERPLVRATSALILVLGLYWLYERVF